MKPPAQPQANGQVSKHSIAYVDRRDQRFHLLCRQAHAQPQQCVAEAVIYDGFVPFRIAGLEEAAQVRARAAIQIGRAHV